MSNDNESVAARRRFLKLLGGGAALLPLAGIKGCSGEDPAPPARTPAGPATPPPAAPPTTPAPNALVRLAEDDPTAVALGYRHDASQVDTARFPQYTADQFCHNCALFQASGSEEWAGCTIFPGRSVNAKGWCSAWAPKS